MILSKEYIAGFFDGEGHVSITWTQRGESRNPKLCIKITNTHLPTLNEIKRQYGGCITTNKKQFDHYLQCYVLNMTVEQSKFFLKDMLPYLFVKKRQAELALMSSETVYRRGKKPVSDEEIRIREYCMEEVRKDKMIDFQIEELAA